MTTDVVTLAAIGAARLSAAEATTDGRVTVNGHPAAPQRLLSVLPATLTGSEGQGDEQTRA